MASGNGKVTASSWAAAMSVGVGTAEALKERHAGLCRWNYHALPCVQQRFGSTNAAARNGACTKGKVPLAAGGAARRRKARQEQEEELRTVMYLSNWGPNN